MGQHLSSLHCSSVWSLLCGKQERFQCSSQQWRLQTNQPIGTPHPTHSVFRTPLPWQQHGYPFYLSGGKKITNLKTQSKWGLEPFYLCREQSGFLGAESKAFSPLDPLDSATAFSPRRTNIKMSKRVRPSTSTSRGWRWKMFQQQRKEKKRSRRKRFSGWDRLTAVRAAAVTMVEMTPSGWAAGTISQMALQCL